MKTLVFFLFLLSSGCNSQIGSVKSIESEASLPTKNSNREQHWEGVFTNGMKQTFISFDVSADGKQLKNLTFKGYWFCDGKLTQDVMGPEKSFAIAGNAVNSVIVEPEGGGATATRYDLKAKFNGSKAEGTFRMNINALGCDTRVLTWTATKK